MFSVLFLPTNASFDSKVKMISVLFLSCAIAGLLWFLSTPSRTRLWSIPGLGGGAIQVKLRASFHFVRRSNFYVDIFQVLDAYNGQTYRAIQGLHKKYGPAVQVGPRTVIFSDSFKR